MTPRNKLRTILKEVPVDIYNNSVIFGFGISVREFKAYIRRKEKLADDQVIDLDEHDFCRPLTDGKTFQFNSGKILVQLPVIPKKGSETLAHEIVHAAMFVLDRAGVKIDADNDEALAYLVGYLTREVNKWL